MRTDLSLGRHTTPLIILVLTFAFALTLRGSDAPNVVLLKARRGAPEMQGPASSLASRTAAGKKLNYLWNDCSSLGQLVRAERIDGPLAPTNALCINGAIAATDPLYDHPESTAVNCNTNVTNARYDLYRINVTGCPTATVTVTTEGPAGCTFVPTGTGAQCAAGTAGINDTTIALYRNGGATAGTASGGAFNPTDVCGTSTMPQRLIAYNDDISGSDLKSSVTLAVGPGTFDIVVSGFSDFNSCEGRGNYNLSVSTVTAGCTLAQTTTAANVSVSGRVVGAEGSGLRGVRVFLTDQSGNTLSAITNAFGYYQFNEVVSGVTYIAGASAKGYRFASRTVQVSDSIAGLDFAPQ